MCEIEKWESFSFGGKGGEGGRGARKKGGGGDYRKLIPSMKGTHSEEQGGEKKEGPDLGKKVERGKGIKKKSLSQPALGGGEKPERSAKKYNQKQISSKVWTYGKKTVVKEKANEKGEQHHAEKQWRRSRFWQLAEWNKINGSVYLPGAINTWPLCGNEKKK